MENGTEPTIAPVPPARRGWARGILHFPITRILLAAVMVLGSMLVGQLGIHAALAALGARDIPPLEGLGAVVVGMFACLGYIAYVRWIEWRPVTELSPDGAVREFLAGVLLGFGLMSATVAGMALLGAYKIEGLNSPLVLVAPLGLALLSGFFEEILARAVLFRIIEEWLGSWLALILSAALFGLAHAWNPGATPVSCLAIALEAGVLLAAAFMLTRRLWLAIGAHAAWNFSQSGLYGIATSGNQIKGLLVANSTGPDWLTGGPFGAETSVLAVLFCTAAGMALLVLAIRRGRMVAPFWRRSSLEARDERG